VSYCAAAEQVAGWLVPTAERGPQGWRWPLQPGVAPDVEHGLGWGTAGPVLFFVEAGPTPPAGRTRCQKTVLPGRGSNWVKDKREGTR
jgi:hypothetical protein